MCNSLVLMFQIKYRTELQFLSCFMWHFVNPINFCWNSLLIDQKQKEGLLFGCSLLLGSISTVETESRPKRLQHGSYSLMKVESKTF